MFLRKLCYCQGLRSVVWMQAILFLYVSTNRTYFGFPNTRSEKKTLENRLKIHIYECLNAGKCIQILENVYEGLNARKYI